MSAVQLKELIIEAKKIMDEQTDSFIIFKNRHRNWLDKQVIGKELGSIDQFL
jgi:CRISPR-associated protein Cas2